MPHDFQADLDAIAAIPAVPTILEVVCRTTGMGFAAVARVTEDRWVVLRRPRRDRLRPEARRRTEGGNHHLRRDPRQPRAVVIDHVAEDARLLQPSHAGDVRLSELHLDADRAAGRQLLRHAVRHRSPAQHAEHAGRDRHVQAVRRTDRAFISTPMPSWPPMRKAKMRAAATNSAPGWAMTCATHWRRWKPARGCCNAPR